MADNNFKVTDMVNFYRGNDPVALTEAYGTPLYVYNEAILRERCREMLGLVNYSRFKVNYSAKANANVRLLEIVREEGLDADAMSPGEICAEFRAGFTPDQLFYISNNANITEMRYALDRGVKISVDSLSQLETLGKANPGGRVAIRINPGVGAGHHVNVITGGSGTKFGINMEYLPQIKSILERFNLRLIGINSHIGSLFMDGSPYFEAIHAVITFAKHFDTLEFVDFGGGFGIPYRKMSGEKRLDLKELGTRLEELIGNFISEYGKEIITKIEPGRYIMAECGVLLGTVNALKQNGPVAYAGTDIGFNVLARPVMYGAHHDIEVYKPGGITPTGFKVVTIVGNICETGDILAKDAELPELTEGDILGILDAGAYGFSMASNYNQRVLPAEILIRLDGSVDVIRQRQRHEDLLAYLDM